MADDVGTMAHLRDLQSVSKAEAKENERRHEFNLLLLSLTELTLLWRSQMEIAVSDDDPES